MVPDEPADEFADDAPYRYGDFLYEINGNPEQGVIRPFMEPVQAEVKPSRLFLQIDLFGQRLVHCPVQSGDVHAGTAPFPWTERELYPHQPGIS